MPRKRNGTCDLRHSEIMTPGARLSQRTLNLFSLESINGFTKVSELLISVTGKDR
jgi:hypothetical protein